MDTRIKQRLAIGFTGALMAGALLIGSASVAADDGTVEPNDVNIGADATGLANSAATLTINSVVVPTTASADTPDAPSGAAPVVEHRDDRSE